MCNLNVSAEFYGLVSSVSVPYPTDLTSYFDPETAYPEASRGYLMSQHEDITIVVLLQSRPRSFLSHPFQFIIHESAQHSTLYILKY
jgi:hypothetical protein